MLNKEKYLIREIKEKEKEEEEILNLIKSSSLLMGLESSKNRFIKDMKIEENLEGDKQKSNDTTNSSQIIKSQPIAGWKAPKAYLNLPLEEIRQSLKLNVENSFTEPIIENFEAMRFPSAIVSALREIKIFYPTPMQMQGLPLVLSGRDLIGIASTGTGKSLIFILPTLMLCLEEEKLNNHKKSNSGPYTIIIVPSRELAVQIHELFNLFVKHLWRDYNSHHTENNSKTKPNLKSVLCIGGVDIKLQIEEITKGCHLIIGTPGRLSDLLEKRKIDSSFCKLLVLDEADRLMDMGFDEEVKKVLEKVALARVKYILGGEPNKYGQNKNSYFSKKTNNDNLNFPNLQKLNKLNKLPTLTPIGNLPTIYKPYQTLIFSSNMPKKIQHYLKNCLFNPAVINIGRAGSANSNVIQEAEFVKEESKLIQILETLEKTPPPVIIFCENKNDVDEIHEYLLLKGIDACSMHGDIKQEERNEAVREFREGLKDVLVATDIVSKGLDFPDIEHVINYDMPKEIENYVLRIGRTGRLGKVGLATTYVNRNLDEAILLDLKHLLYESGQKIPPFLMSLHEEDPSLASIECSFCGGLGHKLSQCHKFENQRMKSILTKRGPPVNI